MTVTDWLAILAAVVIAADKIVRHTPTTKDDDVVDVIKRLLRGLPGFPK